jgi:hypothetical protein
LRARGEVLVDIDWAGGAVRQAWLTSRQARTMRVRAGDRMTDHRLPAGERTAVM